MSEHPEEEIGVMSGFGRKEFDDGGRDDDDDVDEGNGNDCCDSGGSV